MNSLLILRAIILFTFIIILGCCYDNLHHGTIKNLRSDDPGVRLRAVISIDKSGPSPEVISQLVEMLDDNNEIVRVSVMYKLMEIGKPAFPGLPKLFRMLNDDDPVIRDISVRAIGAIGLPDNVVPCIIKALDDEIPHVRSAAIITLSRIGKEARLALPKLKQIALNDPYKDENTGHYRIREQAKNAITVIMNDYSYD